MKPKSDMLKVVRKWVSDIADLRQKHKLVIVMRDHAGENKSQKIIDFFESVGLGVKNYFSTANEQWQNGLTESAINLIMMAARTIMAELILVQGSISGTRCSQCYLQGAHRHYSLAADAW
jgi:hypothetical protein